MSKLRGVLELDVSPDLARRSCLQVFAEMGWHVTREQAGIVEAREDPARLPCHHSPAEAKLQVEESGHGSSVTIETRVPGFGPISSSHARGRQNAVVRRIHSIATSGRLPAASGS